MIKFLKLWSNTENSSKVEIVSDNSEYENALCEKLLEEVNEFIEAKNNDMCAILEIADILEVIDALCILKKYDKDTILQDLRS